MCTTPIPLQSYSRSFSIDAKRSEKSPIGGSSEERERDKSKPEEDEKRPGDLAVA